MKKQKPDIPSWKRTLFQVIFEADTTAGKAFDVILIICILLSVAVVMLDTIQTFSESYHTLLYTLEWFFTGLFTVEYILRLMCVPSRQKYAFSFFGIVDLLAILPTYIGLFIGGLVYLKVIRILRVLRVFRVLKLGNHVKQADLLKNA